MDPNTERNSDRNQDITTDPYTDPYLDRNNGRSTDRTSRRNTAGHPDGKIKWVLLCCAAVVGATLIYRSDVALQPALPKNMPADSRFIATGYDLEHNEHQGVWIACHPGSFSGDNFCRITDGHGAVVFQGDYVPVKDARGLHATQPGARPAQAALHWVTGPVEGISVPLIPMTDGTLLVPYDDRDALLDRWNQHPEQWQALVEQK